MYYYDETAGEWVTLETTVDPDTNTLTATTDHFTYFAVMGEEAAEEEEEVLEIQCAKCGSDTLTPTKIDIYTKNELLVYAVCPKKHEGSYTIKKK